MAGGQFSVFQWFGDERYEVAAEWVCAEEAVRAARELTLRPGALIGAISRVIITDGDDHIVFEWKFGAGVVFPTRGDIAAA